MRCWLLELFRGRLEEPVDDLFAREDAGGAGDGEVGVGPVELFQFAVAGADGEVRGTQHLGVESAVTRGERFCRTGKFTGFPEPTAHLGDRATLADGQRHGVDLAT